MEHISCLIGCSSHLCIHCPSFLQLIAFVADKSLLPVGGCGCDGHSLSINFIAISSALCLMDSGQFFFIFGKNEPFSSIFPNALLKVSLAVAILDSFHFHYRFVFLFPSRLILLPVVRCLVHIALAFGRKTKIMRL